MIGALAKISARRRKGKSSAPKRNVKKGMLGIAAAALKKRAKKKRGAVSGAVARATAAKRGTKLRRKKGGLIGAMTNVAKKAAKGKAGVSAVAKGVVGKRKPARRKARRGAVRRLF